MEDKNKTFFIQSIENVANKFDELQIVSIAPNDPFIKGICEKMTDMHKNIAQYGYTRRK